MHIVNKYMLYSSFFSVLILPAYLTCDGFKISAPQTRQHKSSFSLKLAPKSFYFIRHGQTDWNVENRLQGQLDIPLNAIGREQAMALQDAVSKLDITQIYYSPLSRTHETMETACKYVPEIGRTPVTSLMERNFGEWQGIIWDEHAVSKYRNAVPVHGETEEEYFDRVIACANDILLSNEGQVLIVAHGGVFWSLCRAADIDYQVINNCRILHFVASAETDGQWLIYEL